MSEASKPHSGSLADLVREALAAAPPAPWEWDAEWDTLKAANGRYVLTTRLDFHGKDENGEDDFTSHMDVSDGGALIALAPELAAEYLTLAAENEHLHSILDGERSLEEQYAELEKLVREYEKRLGIPTFASTVGGGDA